MMAAVMGIQIEIQKITLPHDAMIHEDRTKNTKNKHQTGFYPGGCCIYTKTLDVSKEWEEKLVSFEFEGVFENSRVYINGDYASGCKNGYKEFLDEDGAVGMQKDSEVTVVVEGVGALEGMGNASPETDNKYDNNSCKLLNGYVLAIVRAGFEVVEIKVVVSSDNNETIEICIDITN